MKKGPYPNAVTKFTFEQRLGQLGEAPLCRCGCGERTRWDAGRARWRRYASLACYRPPKPWLERDWLYEQYVTLGKSSGTIARECGVTPSAIKKARGKLGIEARSPSECQIGVNVGPKNPAWKGGIAKWSYAPEWKRIARNVRDRAQWTCERCGEQRKRWGRALHVHHKDKDKFNNDLANLVALCASCHRKVEYQGGDARL